MAHYHLTHLDLSTRMELAIQMLAADRPWGRVTQLAQTHGTSRKFLYQLRDKAQRVLQQSLVAQTPGPKPPPTWVWLDDHFLQRAIVTLSLLPPSLRNLQLALELLFGQRRSLGYIQQTLQAAGERAHTANQRLQPTRPILGEVDEIYQTRRPCLTVVDGRSLLVLNLAKQVANDRTTWGVTLCELMQRGIAFEDIAFDGSLSLQAGIRDAELACPQRPDLFHLYRLGHRITAKLERHAYQALRIAYRAQRAEQEAQAEKRRRGRPLKVAVSYQEAAAGADQALGEHDLWCWLFGELRQALQPFTPQGRLTTGEQAHQTMALIVTWMQDLQVAKVTPFANNLANLLAQLVTPLEALERRLAAWRHDLDPETERFLVWAWQHRQALALHIERDLPTSLHPVARALWQALADFHRTSSLAEALHSWLRPFLELHRGIPAWLLPLLQAFWNHHPFQRGKRRGKSPLAWAGLEPVPSLSQWIDSLLPFPQVVDPDRWVFKVPEKCYPIYD